MPAHNQDFPWTSYYRHYNFFESRIAEHGRVANIEVLGDGLYSLTLESGRSLRVFICECYSFSIAEYHETSEILGPLDAIIINSNWCGYTYDAKRECRANGVGLFKIGDFMVALGDEGFSDYLNEYETEYFRREGWN